MVSRPPRQYVSPYLSTGLPWEKPPPGYPGPYLGRGLPSDWQWPPYYPSTSPPTLSGNIMLPIVGKQAFMFDFDRWSSYHWVGLHLLINKLLVFQMQLYLCGNTYTCMCKNKQSKSHYGIMDVWRGIWYSNFSACKEIYCIEEQTDHRATFPLGKLASREAGKQKHLANL